MQKQGGQNSARKRAPNARLSELEAKVAFYEGNFDASGPPELLLASADHRVNSDAVIQQQGLRSPTIDDQDPQADDHNVNDAQVDLTSSADIRQEDPVPPVQLVTPVTPAIIREPQISSDTRSSSSEPALMNPLALGVSTYTPHASRMPVYLGTSSNWSFGRRVLAMSHEQILGSPLSPQNLLFQSEAYDLGWNGLRTGQSSFNSEAKALPTADHAIYLINAAKFHVGQMFHLFDEESFMQSFSIFHKPSADKSGLMPLWYAHYLLILAFGKAFLARTSKGRRPAGGEFFVQAMAILPDVTFLCLHPIETIEILCCATLYLHSLDFRSPAYQLIGQALRIALEHGMHTTMESQHVPQALVQRCRKIWWTVYVLDRQLSSLMGVPSSIRDEDISAELPLYLESPYRATALDIQVKLSRAIAKISNNVYGPEGRLNRQYVSHIKEALKDVAHITDQLHDSFELSPDDSEFGISRLSAYLHVLHHQCIILATRPLLHTLLEARLQSRPPDHRRFDGIKPLVIMCIESAFQNLKILAQLQEESLLECFLSFDLDAAFSSAVILLMAALIDPSLIGEEIQLTELSYRILDEMTNRGNRVAGFLKLEIQQLETILSQAAPLGHRQVSITDSCISSRVNADSDESSGGILPPFMDCAISDANWHVGEAALEAKENSLPLDPQVVLNADIESWRKGTLDTIDLLGETDYLAVKLTGAGPEVTKAFAEKRPLPQQMIDALDEIALGCKNRNARILVDAESQRFQWGIMDATIDLMRKFNRNGRALVYSTYQAYLKSTPTTLEKHLTLASDEGFTLGLKLVRGAYINSDERSLIHDTKQDTDDAYNMIAQGALSQQLGSFGSQGSRPFPSVNLFLASHNKQSVFAAHDLHQKRLRAMEPTVPVGYAQLQGMSDQVSFGLLKLRDNNGTSPDVFKCSTWGTMSECLAYLLRRAVENRDAVSRTGDELKALRAESWKRFKALFISPAPRS
ncbi:proline oxidase, partial [Aureobasidium melanogenum]